MENLKRYDIVLVDFGTNKDCEQSGIRPAIIIQNDIGNYYSTTTIVMPLSSKIKNLRQPTHTLIRKGRNTGLIKDSMVVGEGMRQVSKNRIIKMLGSITCETEKMEIRRVYDANFGE